MSHVYAALYLRDHYALELLHANQEEIVNLFSLAHPLTEVDQGKDRQGTGELHLSALKVERSNCL